MPDNTIRGRFAPSPSGRLHLGNMLTFLLAWLDLRARGGTMVFRLEDLDPERSWEHYADLMADDLLWLGLDWDEGWRPGSQDCRQGTRAQRYTAALDALTERGMVYDCYCSRAERLAASAPHPGEPREAGCPCRTLSEQEVQKRLRMGRRAAKKLAVTDADIAFVDAHYGPQAAELRHGRDDFLIRRSDGVFAYQLAVTVDDGLSGVTEVVRGSDLISSTPRQIWLYRLFGFEPPHFVHIPLLCDVDGRRLSKRDEDLDLGLLRERFTPEQVIGALAFAAHLTDRAEPASVRELVQDFDWSRIPRHELCLPPMFR